MSRHVARSIVAALLAAAPFLSASAWGQGVTLAWNPSTDPTVTGYKLYYGGATQSYTNMVAVGSTTNATISGLLPGGEYFFAATAIDGVGLESAFSNEISYQVPGELPGPALPPITWPALADIVYGTALGPGQLNATSSVPGTFTYNPPAGTVLNAGSQVLSVTFNPTDTNSYAPVTTNAALVVLPEALTITAANTSKPYGAPLPPLTASYSGFVNGDTASSLTTPPALATTATAASPVGRYSITASGAASPNYTITYAGGTLTVNAAALTITAVNTSKLYGSAVPALTASYSGFVNGDTASSLTTPPALTTTATAASPVGSYSITASGAASPNYTISYTSGTLTVNEAALTITAVNTSKLYGAAVPALTARYSGFVNGDAASSLTTPPALATTATAASPVGTYPITASGAAGANYVFIYTPGTLVVTKASTAGLLSSSGNPSLPNQAVTFSVSLSAVAPGAGTPTGTVQFEVDGVAAGAPVSLSAGTASYTPTTNLTHGSHTVAGQYAGDANFLGITNLLSPPQVINTPPVAHPVTIYRGLSEGVMVGIPGLLANVSDADGDLISLVGVSATSANGGTVMTNKGWVFFTPASGSTNTDTFTYVVTDGWSAPVAGTVTVDITVDTEPSRNLAIVNLGNGTVAIGGQGIPARTYIIQYTTSTLPTTNWVTLGTVTADSSGSFVFVETAVSGLRFYRAIDP